MDVLLRQMIPSTTLLLILSLFEAFVMHMLICKKPPLGTWLYITKNSAFSCRNLVGEISFFSFPYANYGNQISCLHGTEEVCRNQAVTKMQINKLTGNMTQA